MKNCAVCNAESNDNANFCWYCGKDIEHISLQVSKPQGKMKICDVCSAESSNKAIYCQYCGKNIEHISSWAMKKDRTRIRGWLLFFLVDDIFAVVMYTLSMFPMLPIIGERQVSLQNIMTFFIYAVPLFVSVILRLKRDRHFLLWFQIAKIAASLNIIVPYVLLGHMFSAVFLAIILGGVVVLFTLYYCKSRRVKAYMGSVEYKKKAILKF